jgi:hypothetical protein
MRNIRLLRTNFGRLSADNLVSRASIISHAIHTPEFAAVFPAINPTKEQLATALAEYSASLSAETSRSIVALRKAKRDILEDLLNLLALHLERIANGDPKKLSLTGYDIKKPSGGRTEGNTPAPENLRLFHALRNQILAKVQGMGRRVVLIGAYSYDPINGPWFTINPTTNSQKILFTGLERGRDVYIKVQAVGAHGPSDWSDIAVIMVM